MKKIIQTLQQALDLIDTRDRKKMQQIIRDLKTIRIRTERKIERQKDTTGCAISLLGSISIIIIYFIYQLWTTTIG
jgi:hypothetical protein|tara:strand:+ start:573 stop:800 length:228 start_codon:yes stop_codon:yes gene_type:complete